MSIQDLKGKVAIVTGSAGGIGFDIAKSLAQRGAHVMLSDIIESEKAESIRADLQKSCGINVGYTQANVADYAQIEHLMQETAKLGDGSIIDIVVNNAGIQYKAPIDQFPIDKWKLIIDINLSGVFYGIRAAAPFLKNSPAGGRIFNIASVNGHVGSPEKAAYCAAKAAVVNLTRVAETDLRAQGIACFCISPGFLDTPLARKQVSDFMASDGLDEQAAILKLLEFQKIKEFIPVSHVSNIVGNLSALPKDKAMELSGRDALIDNGWRDNVYAQRPPLLEASLLKELVNPAPGQAASAA